MVGDRTAEEVDGDGLRRSALLWQFTVLGEAASQIPVEAKAAHPQVACRAATRLRKRIVHGYWDIDVETPVSTAVDDLPQMIGQLDPVISTLPDGRERWPTSLTRGPGGVLVERRPIPVGPLMSLTPAATPIR